MSTDSTLSGLINEIRSNKGQPHLAALSPGLRLREDLGMDSFDLAELTVKIEEACGVDVFADGLVHTVGELAERMSR